jgi:hypothetical protein
LGALLLAAASFSASAVELRVAHASTWPGGSVSLPVSLSSASGAVAAQLDLTFDPAVVSLTGITPGPGSAGHFVDQQELTPGHWRALVYAATDPVLASGTLLSTEFTVAANAPHGVTPIGLSTSILSQPQGVRVQPLSEVNGALSIYATETIVSLAILPGAQMRATPDLFHWANVARYTNFVGSLTVTNPLPAGRAAYFYRTASVPASSPPLVPAPVLSGLQTVAGGAVRFQLEATPGSVWRIQGSPDLTHWGGYGVVANPTGTRAVTNTPVGKPGQYFHRAVQP